MRNMKYEKIVLVVVLATSSLHPTSWKESFHNTLASLSHTTKKIYQRDPATLGSIGRKALYSISTWLVASTLYHRLERPHASSAMKEAAFISSGICLIPTLKISAHIVDIILGEGIPILGLGEKLNNLKLAHGLATLPLLYTQFFQHNPALTGTEALLISGGTGLAYFSKSLIYRLGNLSGIPSLLHTAQTNNLSAAKFICENNPLSFFPRPKSHPFFQEDQNQNSVFHIAAQNNYQDMAKFLLKQYDAVSEIGGLRARNRNCEVPLHIAAQHNYVDLAKFFLTHAKHEAPDLLNSTDNSNKTPLQTAVEHGHQDMALLLKSCTPCSSDNNETRISSLAQNIKLANVLQAAEGDKKRFSEMSPKEQGTVFLHWLYNNRNVANQISQKSLQELIENLKKENSSSSQEVINILQGYKVLRYEKIPGDVARNFVTHLTNPKSQASEKVKQLHSLYHYAKLHGTTKNKTLKAKTTPLVQEIITKTQTHATLSQPRKRNLKTTFAPDITTHIGQYEPSMLEHSD